MSKQHIGWSWRVQVPQLLTNPHAHNVRICMSSFVESFKKMPWLGWKFTNLACFLAMLLTCFSVFNRQGWTVQMCALILQWSPLCFASHLHYLYVSVSHRPSEVMTFLVCWRFSWCKHFQIDGPQLMQHGFRDAIAKVGLAKLVSDLFWVGLFFHLDNQVCDFLPFFFIGIK